MEVDPSTSPNSLKVTLPASCHPAKRRRAEEASDRPLATANEVQPDREIGAVYSESIQQQGFLTIHEADVQRSEYHLSKAELFVERVKAAYKPRWNNRHLSYTDVSSLLLCWEDDDLNVREEVHDLANVLRETYQYKTDIWAMPSSSSCYLDLAMKVNSFATRNDGEGKLFILYYGGHAYKAGSSQPIWVSNRSATRTEVSSEMVFAGLRNLDADVLLLFDSCQAIPESFESIGRGIVSVLASTGFEPGPLTVSPEPGPHSFTRSLINELCDASNPQRARYTSNGLSDISLHSRIIERLIYYKPEPLRLHDGSYMRDGNNKHVMEPYRRRTPIYRCLTQKSRAIPLVPLRPSIPTPEQSPQNSSDEECEDQPTGSSHSRNRKVPCVLISVRLTPHALDKPDIDAWAEMLLSMPSDAEKVTISTKEITIENYYQSCSGLMIVKMPVDIWGWIQKHPAMTFIGYIQGDNEAPTINKQIKSRLASYPSRHLTNKLAEPICVALQVSPHTDACTSRRIELSSEHSEQTLHDDFDRRLDISDTPHEIANSAERGNGNDRATSHRETSPMRIDVPLQDFQQGQKERDEILGWLTKFEYAPQQSDLISRRHPGTGQWFLNSSQFNAWVEGNGEVLFCPGIPRAGKTILTSMVVDKLVSGFENSENIGVAYIYCDYRLLGVQKADWLLAALLKQLARARPSLPTCLTSLYTKHNFLTTRPSSAELRAALRSVIALYKKTYIVVDALDELQGASQAEIISEIFGLQAECRASVFATSRFVPVVMERFRGSTSLEIRASDADKRKYIDYQLSCRPYLMHRPALKDAIDATITDGVFLFTSHNLDFVPQFSGDIDPDVYAPNTYICTMERILDLPHPQNILGTEVLSWVAFAKRPLTTVELQHGISFASEDSTFDGVNLPRIEDMISACAGLVKIDTHNNVVCPVHASIKEFLEKHKNHYFPNAEEIIGTACVKYLSSGSFASGPCKTDAEFEKRLLLYPLYDYAAHYWGYHICNTQYHLSSVLEFLQQSSKVEASTQALMVTKKRPDHPGYSQDFPKQTTGLHLAAHFGLMELVEELVHLREKGFGINQRDSYGRTPLIVAAAERRGSVVKLLLDNGADIKAQDESNQTSLSCAATRGSEDCVLLLLKGDLTVAFKFP